jgi:hypothetical protein
VRLTLAAVAALSVALPAGASAGVQKDQVKDQEAGKKELLKRIDALEGKLPPELARKLIVLSMKIATGWCSPFQAKEFEAEVDKLPNRERKRFEKEWKLVREHPAWPSVPAKPDKSSPSK